MLTVVFVAALLWVAVHLLIISVRAAWGFAKVVCTVLLLPAFIVFLALMGLFYISIPLLLIVGLCCLLRSKARA